MNRRTIAIGVSSVSGLAVLAVGAWTMFGGSGSARAVDLHTSPVAAVRAAGEATQKAKTAQVDTVITMATPAVAAHGATPAQPARTTTMHGSGLFDFGKQIGSIDLTMPNGALHEVLTPASLYLHPGADPAAASAAAASGKGWSRVDIGKLSDGNLVSGGSTDPAMAIAMLAGTTPDVKYLGQDTVRGVAVAHYEGTLDLTEAANAPLPAGDANAAADKKALSNAAHAFVTTKIPFDAYLDDSGRLRRFVAKFQFVVPGQSHTVAEVTSATELFGFGVPVGVATPPPAPASPSGTHK